MCTDVERVLLAHVHVTEGRPQAFVCLCLLWTLVTKYSRAHAWMRIHACAREYLACGV